MLGHMELQILPKASITFPPKWAARYYLVLKPPTWVFAKNLSKKLGTSESLAKRFLHEGATNRLLVRVSHGAYIAINPSVAFRLGAVSRYWADLLAINDALRNSAYTRWAFACLGAMTRTAYVPDRPWLVTHPDVQPPTDRPWQLFDTLDRFGYRHQEPPNEKWLKVSVLGYDVNLPVTTSEDTALILAATGLPREVEAAKEILRTRPPDRRLARKLNFLGVRTEGEELSSEDPRVELPAFVEERRRRLGLELLRAP